MELEGASLLREYRQAAYNLRRWAERANREVVSREIRIAEAMEMLAREAQLDMIQYTDIPVLHERTLGRMVTRVVPTFRAGEVTLTYRGVPDEVVNKLVVIQGGEQT